MNKKMMVLVGVVFVSIGLVGIRVWQLNTSAPTILTEHYEMGEWVDLNGAFLKSSSEYTNGYSIKVNEAQLCSYNEYIENYGLDSGLAVEGLDEKSIIDLEVEIKNRGNRKGGVLIFECKLVPERKNEYFIRDNELWSQLEPKMKDNFLMRLVEDSDYTTHIPYKVNLIDDNLGQYKKPINDTSFELVVSNSPVRKVVEINLRAQ